MPAPGNGADKARRIFGLVQDAIGFSDPGRHRVFPKRSLDCFRLEQRGCQENLDRPLQVQRVLPARDSREVGIRRRSSGVGALDLACGRVGGHSNDNESHNWWTSKRGRKRRHGFQHQLRRLDRPLRSDLRQDQFYGSTNPNAKDYANAATGISVTNIGVAKSSMTADLVPKSVSGDHVGYDDYGYSGYAYGFSSSTVWTGVRFTNSTAYTDLDGFQVYIGRDSSTVDFYLYDNINGGVPGTLLHSQTGFAANTGWNRFLLSTPQDFPAGIGPCPGAEDHLAGHRLPGLPGCEPTLFGQVLHRLQRFRNVHLDGHLRRLQPAPADFGNSRPTNRHPDSDRNRDRDFHPDFFANRNAHLDFFAAAHSNRRRHAGSDLDPHPGSDRHPHGGSAHPHRDPHPRQTRSVWCGSISLMSETKSELTKSRSTVSPKRWHEYVPGGWVEVMGDSSVTSTDETIRITKPMRIEAFSGPVRIGPSSE